jgi:hypothetical protein
MKLKLIVLVLLIVAIISLSHLSRENFASTAFVSLGNNRHDPRVKSTVPAEARRSEVPKPRWRSLSKYRQGGVDELE